MGTVPEAVGCPDLLRLTLACLGCDRAWRCSPWALQSVAEWRACIRIHLVRLRRLLWEVFAFASLQSAHTCIVPGRAAGVPINDILRNHPFDPERCLDREVQGALQRDLSPATVIVGHELLAPRRKLEPRFMGQRVLDVEQAARPVFPH